MLEEAEWHQRREEAAAAGDKDKRSSAMLRTTCATKFRVAAAASALYVAPELIWSLMVEHT